MPRRDREKLDDQPLRLGPIGDAANVARCMRRLLRTRATLRLDRERFKDLIDGLGKLHEVYRAVDEAKAHADLLLALPQLEQLKQQQRAHVLRLVRGGKPAEASSAIDDGAVA